MLCIFEAFLVVAVHADESFAGELDRIAQQVDQDLRESVGISQYPPRNILALLEGVADRFGVGTWLQDGESGSQRVVQVKRLMHDAQCTG